MFKTVAKQQQMIICQLYIKSKNKQSLNNFSKWLKENQKLFFIVKHFQVKTKKSKFTILKSPHVNKTAQEQFEERNYSKNIKIITGCLNSFLIYLKRSVELIFPDVKITYTLNKTKTQLTQNFYSFNNVKLEKKSNVYAINKAYKNVVKHKNDTYIKKRNLKLHRTRKIINLLHVYNLTLKNSSGSSVGRAKD
jgi:ribosomal protein S10